LPAERWSASSTLPSPRTGPLRVGTAGMRLRPEWKRRSIATFFTTTESLTSVGDDA
jgi:hypothetical protein